MLKLKHWKKTSRSKDMHGKPMLLHQGNKKWNFKKSSDNKQRKIKFETNSVATHENEGKKWKALLPLEMCQASRMKSLPGKHWNSAPSGHNAEPRQGGTGRPPAHSSVPPGDQAPPTVHLTTGTCRCRTGFSTYQTLLGQVVYISGCCGPHPKLWASELLWAERTATGNIVSCSSFF